MSRDRLNPNRIEDPLTEDHDLEELYSPDYLVEVADGEAREERLAELKRRIEHDAYSIDPDRIADGLLSKGDLD